MNTRDKDCRLAPPLPAIVPYDFLEYEAPALTSEVTPHVSAAIYRHAKSEFPSGDDSLYAEPLPPSLQADSTKFSRHLVGEMPAKAQPALRRAYLRPQPPLEKLSNRLPNLPRMGLQGEMSRVEEPDFRIRIIPAERLRSRRQEKWILRPPHR
jgi:hypothetical protein